MAVSELGDAARHKDLAALADDDHKQYALILQGTLANRPAAGRAGRLYVATDEYNRTYYDDGASWSQSRGTEAGRFAKQFLFGGN